MPPRRGRGRGGSQGRPPPAIRNAMMELGKGSLATFEMLAQAAATSNVDAARGYFPELEPGKKAEQIRLLESETNMVKLSQDVARSIQNSPHYVESRGRRKVKGWSKEVQTVSNYFSARKATDTGLNETEDLWDISKSWFIPELLPIELMPRRIRHVKQEKKARKRAKLENGTSSLANNLNDESMANGDADEESADGDGEERDGNEVAVEDEDDDDLELDADYQTGIKFDDDEGYEEQDSGAEEATF